MDEGSCLRLPMRACGLVQSEAIPSCPHWQTATPFFGLIPSICEPYNKGKGRHRTTTFLAALQTSKAGWQNPAVRASMIAAGHSHGNAHYDGDQTQQAQDQGNQPPAPEPAFAFPPGTKHKASQGFLALGDLFGGRGAWICASHLALEGWHVLPQHCQALPSKLPNILMPLIS